MRAAIHLHGVELGLRVERGRLESDVLRRYGAHLGAIADPDIDVVLRPVAAGDRPPTDVTLLDIRGGAPRLELAVADGAATDLALGALVAPMLVRHGAVLLRATAAEDGTLVIDPAAGGAHLLVVHRAGGRWRAGTTAFGDPGASYPRRTTLRALRIAPGGGADPLAAAVVLGAASAACRSEAARLVADLVRSLPPPAAVG
jgi:hypothetical protein